MVDQKQEHAEFRIAGTHYPVHELTGREGLSQLFEFKVKCDVKGAPPPVPSLIGQPATIALRDSLEVAREIRGIISEARVNIRDHGESILQVTVRPAPFVLTVGRDSRDFQEKNVIDIAKMVLADAPFEVSWRTTKTYPERVYTVQYREDDWSFISRLFETYGIYYWFDHTAGSVLVFADDSTAAPELPGGARMAFEYESGALADSDCVQEIASEKHATTTKFTVGSFDPDRPMLKLLEEVGEGPLEVYTAHGGGPDTPAECSELAKVSLEGAYAARTGVAGSSTSVRLIPGMVFELDDHPISELDQRYLVTSSEYVIHQRLRAGADNDQRRYYCRFTGILVDTPYRPPKDTPAATQLGAQSGMVVGAAGEEIFPDARGRVRVQHYWDRIGARDEKAGTWMRVAQRGSAESMLLPRVGWTVLSFNEEGSVDTPSVFNRVPDGEHLPPYPLPANKTRLTFKTATSPGGGSFNEVRFEDMKGQEEMFLNASKDMNVLIQNLKNETIAHDHMRTVGIDHTITVNNGVVKHVGNDQQVDIGGNETIDIGKNYTKTIKGNETISVGGNRKLDVGGEHMTSSEKNRTLNVGAAMIDVSLGPIGADGGLFTVLVGGVALKLSGGMIGEDVGKLSVQLIGGVKLETAKRNRVTDVKDHYKEMVGGALLLDTDGAFTDNADEVLSYSVAGTLTGEAPSVWIEAKDKIEVKCGGTAITVDADGIEIKSPKFDLSGAKLEYDTKSVEHN